MLTFWILFTIAFSGTYYVMPHSIRKLRENGYVAHDMYKNSKPQIPTNAGIIVLFISFISISILPLIARILNQFSNFEVQTSDLSEINLAFLLVISIYAVYGLVDDLVDIGRKLKLLLPICFGYPLISVISPSEIWIPLFGDFDLNASLSGEILWSDLFRISIIPIYIMVVSNLVNMHSGYNGLQSGLSLIIIFTLLLESWIDGILSSIIPAGAFSGSILALWFFNKYPSQVFEGNVGSLLFGSIIGSIIVIQEYWWFGFFILIPHTFNFILWLIWLVLMRKNPKKYLEKDGKHKKFADIRKDNTIEVPNLLTLKWYPNYFFRMQESSSVIFMYFVTIIFCLSGSYIF